ncbi:MAG: tetratricopeptide repeat protein [Candidatus Lokiarchaeota archaeon]|nr:tetratricopeptide repeat protein [Candidatus Lokiarchaeota archaeon]
MSVNDFIEVYDKPISSIFTDQEKLTFLAGAGISMDAPSNLPSARQIIRTLLEYISPDEEIDKILQLDMLRYELIVEILQEVWDTELIFMDYFDLITEPNFLHLFLANAIKHHHYVLTTNFDYLIEHALKRVINKSENEEFFPIITKEDFLEYKDPEKLFKEKKFPLYKIHGSKINLSTGENTIDSLVTTIKDLGKDRAKGETFAIEPYKKPAVNNLMRNRTLIVMGYSGSDDFDIGPVLKEISDLNKLVWIEHVSADQISCFRIIHNKNLKKSPQIPKTILLLSEIRSNTDFEVYYIKANTSRILENEFWTVLFPNENIIYPKKSNEILKPPRFKDWAEQHFKQIPEHDKYYFSARTYYELNQFQDVIRAAENGLNLWDDEQKEDIELQSGLLNLLSLTFKDIGEFEKSLEFYKKCLEVETDVQNHDGIAAAHSGIGYLYLNEGKIDLALGSFMTCLKIAREHNLLEKEGNYLNNIAMCLFQKGEYSEALDRLRKSLDIAEQVGNLANKALVYSNIGRIQKTQLNYDLALKNYEQALKINQELGQIRAVATRYNLIGQIFYMQDNLDQAFNYFNRSNEIYQELNDISNGSRSLGNIALIYTQQKQFHKAKKIYNELIQLAEKLKQPGSKAVRLNNLGYVYQCEGNYKKALEFYQMAADIDKEYEFKDRLATDLNNIALCYYNLEDLDTSLKYFLESLQIVEEINHLELQETIRVNLREIYEKIGDQYKEQGEYEKAVDNYKNAYEIEIQRKYLDNQAYYLNSIGIAFYYADKNEKAVNFFKRALEIAEQTENNKKASDNLYYIGLILEEAGKINEAIDNFKRSLSYAQAENLENDIPLLLEKIGKMYSKLENLQKSIEYLKKAYNIELYRLENENETIEMIEKLWNLSQTCLKIDEINMGVQTLKKALKLARKLDLSEEIKIISEQIDKFNKN